MPNATLDQLAPRGPIQAGDLLPILPNGGGSLQNVAAAGIKSFVLAGSGAQTGLLVLTPSGDPTGAADTTAINSALATGNDVFMSAGVYVTNSSLLINSATQCGQKIYGAGATSSTGLGANSTVIRPTNAVSSVFIVDGTSFGGYIVNSGVTDMTVDMANMVDGPTSVAMSQIQAFDCYYSNVRVINFGTAKVSWLFSTGAYVTVLTTCQGGVIRFSGAALSNATTTMLFSNCDISWIDHNYYVNVTFVGGAVQRPYDNTVPIIFLPPGTTPYGYTPNVSGIYCAIMSNINNSKDFTSIGCDWEQGGGYPSTYNDGTHGTLPLIRVVQITSTAINTTFINGDFAGCYILDYGLNTRVLGYQGTGMDLCTGKDFHLNDIATSGNIVGFTNFANYFGTGASSTFQISAAIGAASFAKVSIQPPTDADQIFTVKNAAGYYMIDLATSPGILSLDNGTSLVFYSDTGTTETFEINGPTGIMKGFSGGAEKIRITPANASINVASGGFYAVNGTYVVGARKAGWGATSGSVSRAAYASYPGQTLGASYSLTAAQTTDNAVAALSQTVAALLSDLTSHGLIGP